MSRPPDDRNVDELFRCVLEDGGMKASGGEGAWEVVEKPSCAPVKARRMAGLP